MRGENIENELEIKKKVKRIRGNSYDPCHWSLIRGTFCIKGTIKKKVILMALTTRHLYPQNTKTGKRTLDSVK